MGIHVYLRFQLLQILFLRDEFHLAKIQHNEITKTLTKTHTLFVIKTFTKVCLIVWSISSQSRFFLRIWIRHHCRRGLLILTYARHSWPLSSEGSLACHTYCDSGHPFIMVTSEDQWHSHLLPSVSQWSCHYLFYYFGLSRLGIEHLTFHCATAAVLRKSIIIRVTL